MKLLKKPFLGFVIFLVLFSSTTPINATSLSDSISDPLNGKIKDEYVQELKNLGYSERDIEKGIENAEIIGHYIEIDESFNLLFDEKTAVANGVDEQLVIETKRDIEKTQELMKEDNQLLASCPGITGYYPGQDMYMFNFCATNMIVNAIYAGATLTSIAGILISLVAPPSGAAFGIAGLLMAFGATVISSYNRGSGIFILRGKDIYSQP